MTNQSGIPKVLLVTNDLASTHSVRQAIRRAGLTIILDPVSRREQFLSRLHSGSADLILAGANGLEDLEISEIVEQSRNSANEVPIILLDRETDNGRVLTSWQDASANFVRVAQLDRLPSVLERVLREQHTRNANARLQGELNRVAEMLRENQKLIAIGRLTASIAHEINNPLESITNLLYLMEVDHDSPRKWEEYLRLAQRELNRVVQISKQTLTFSRETTAPVRVHFPELIDEVLILYGRKIADKNLRIVRQYESNEAVAVFPGEMRQVLSNLISNAIEASEENGMLMLRIRSARNWSDQGVHGIRISVADNGAGMSAEVRNRLGEPFFTTKGQNGTGLGLWVTRSILHRYGGSLQLRSSVAPLRHGTVFSMFLPTNLRPQAVLPRGGAATFRLNESARNGTTSRISADDTERSDPRQRASGD
jgi:two-component system, NtrC family, sensor kinase